MKSGWQYKPNVKVDGNGDGVLDAREVTFRIPNGVKVYGEGKANSQTIIIE